MFTQNRSYSDTEVSVEANLGLVRLCAGRFRGRGIEYEELYSAGCMGLVKAVKAFDGSRGVRFSTYAVPDKNGKGKLSRGTACLKGCDLMKKS